MKRIALLALAALFLAGCATYHDTGRERMQALPEHYAQFDLQLAWATRTADGRTVVDGIAKNVRYEAMYDLEIWVAVLDAKGRVKSRSVTYVIPRKLDLDQSAQFGMQLPVAAPPGTRLRFTYRYRGSEGGEGPGGGLERGTNWMQSFDTVVRPR